MDTSSDTARHPGGTLRGWIAVSLAFEEAAIEVLADGASRLRREGRDAAAMEIEATIRRHRVGLLKHRAVMGARGVEV